MAQKDADELIQEQEVLEFQLPQLDRVPSELSLSSSTPSSIGDGDSSISSPPRQRRRVQMRTPERPIRFVGTPERASGPPHGTPGAYTPRNLRRLAFETNPFYGQSQKGTAERALQDMMAEDDFSQASASSGSQSLDLFNVNETRGRSREPEPLQPGTTGNALFPEMSKDELAEIAEIKDELQGPVLPGALFADTLSTPVRKKKGGIKSNLKKSKSKRSKGSKGSKGSKRTRKTKRRTRKSKQRKIKKKKTLKKKKAGRRT